MKAEEVIPSSYEEGPFVLGVQRCVFERTEDPSYFECLLLERKDGLLYYIHLVEDPRFSWFAWISSFSRLFTEQDMVEYNSHAWNVFHKLAQPTWKLSRHSIVYLLKHCQQLAKKAKKGR